MKKTGIVLFFLTLLFFLFIHILSSTIRRGICDGGVLAFYQILSGDRYPCSRNLLGTPHLRPIRLAVISSSASQRSRPSPLQEDGVVYKEGWASSADQPAT